MATSKKTGVIVATLGTAALAVIAVFVKETIPPIVSPIVQHFFPQPEKPQEPSPPLSINVAPVTVPSALPFAPFSPSPLPCPRGAQA